MRHTLSPPPPPKADGGGQGGGGERVEPASARGGRSRRGEGERLVAHKNENHPFVLSQSKDRLL